MTMTNLSKRKAVVISASSDIGYELCKWWYDKSWELFGTYRTQSAKTGHLSEMGVSLVQCALESKDSVDEACRALHDCCAKWDALVFCPGMLDPIGCFSDCDYDHWNTSIDVNFINQIRVLHRLLPDRNLSGNSEPRVIFFAGGGTNSAPKGYSAYTVSKIALIKMCELLDAEIQDTGFIIIGPGWVKTKIHQATLKAGPRSGEAYNSTKKRLQTDAFTPMQQILECCDWIVHSDRRLVSGRNFSVANDRWGEAVLAEMLKRNIDMYKLRRSGNQDLLKSEEN